VCLHCGFQRPAFNSCRNRHCPGCNALKQHRWIEQREQRLLPTPHFHVVFTVPAQLRSVALHDRSAFFAILFEAASQTLLALAADPKRLGAQPAITAILHTWTRDLSFHPHVHCIVSGGGLTADGKWAAARRDHLFPVKVLSRLFRGKMLAALRNAAGTGKLHVGDTPADQVRFAATCNAVQRKDWVVYCKKPFGGPEQLLKYLGRYTHRVAISNARILDVDDKSVRFLTKNGKSATLKCQEFIRRFLLHVLPSGFVKIRHYGLLAPANVGTRLALAREQLQARHPPPSTPAIPAPIPPPADWRELLHDLTGVDLSTCPRCSGPMLPHSVPPAPIHALAAAPAAPDTS
jgi:hypothetical protein